MVEAKITGIFEYIIGTDNAEETIKYWNELGFKVIQEGQFSKEDTKELYGVEAPLKSYRLRCGNFDTHGNLRIFVWDKFVIKDSPSFTNALSPGNRWVTQRTEDIFGVTYDYDDCAKRGGKWIVSDLVRNYLGATGVGKNFYDRYKGVYEVLIMLCPYMISTI